MRKFIVSDLHGDGNIYNSIMSYLDNINKEEDLTLYINGDLIDRGWDSGRIFLDVYDRIKNNKGFKIEYLGGNHELLMWQAYEEYKDAMWAANSNWRLNGGFPTAAYISDEYASSLSKRAEIANFVGNLKIYHKFEEKMEGKNIVLVHAKCPVNASFDCDLRIKDDGIHDLVWGRDGILGNDNYFTIIGHTPLKNADGYEYYKYGNYLNIDGGCAAYVNGMINIDHVPLVEVLDNKLVILTFNNSNKIISGNYFFNGNSYPIPNLDQYRKYLNPKVRIKSLHFEDGIPYFG